MVVVGNDEIVIVRLRSLCHVILQLIEMVLFLWYKIIANDTKYVSEMIFELVLVVLSKTKLSHHQIFIQAALTFLYLILVDFM